MLEKCVCVCVRGVQTTQGVGPEPAWPQSGGVNRTQLRMASLAPLSQGNTLADRPPTARGRQQNTQGGPNSLTIPPAQRPSGNKTREKATGAQKRHWAIMGHQ